MLHLSYCQFDVYYLNYVWLTKNTYTAIENETKINQTSSL